MKLQIHPSLILWLSILFYFNPHLVLPFFLAAGFHELGHYIALRQMNRSPNRLILSFSGAEMKTPPLSYREEQLAAAAGPGFSLLFALLWPLFPVTAFYSLLLGIINLLPLPGLDGFRIITATYCLRHSPELARRTSVRIALCTSLLFTLFTVLFSYYHRTGLWPVLAALVFLIRSLPRTRSGIVF